MVEAPAPTGPARRHAGRVCSRRPQALHVLCDQGGGHHPSGAQRLLMVWALLVPCQAWQGHTERALDFEPLPESEGLSRIHVRTCLLCRSRLAGTRRAASPGRWRPRATCTCPPARRPLRPGARTPPPDAPQAGRGVLPAGGAARPVAVAGECSATPPHPQRPWWLVEVNLFVFQDFGSRRGIFLVAGQGRPWSGRCGAWKEGHLKSASPSGAGSRAQRRVSASGEQKQQQSERRDSQKGLAPKPPLPRVSRPASPPRSACRRSRAGPAGSAPRTRSTNDASQCARQ